MSDTHTDSLPSGSTPRFAAGTTMEEAMAKDPGLPVVLMQFHIGGCSLCGFEPSDTIQKVAEDNGVPLERLLDAMNRTRA